MFVWRLNRRVVCGAGREGGELGSGPRDTVSTYPNQSGGVTAVVMIGRSRGQHVKTGLSMRYSLEEGPHTCTHTRTHAHYYTGSHEKKHSRREHQLCIMLPFYQQHRSKPHSSLPPRPLYAPLPYWRVCFLHSLPDHLSRPRDGRVFRHGQPYLRPHSHDLRRGACRVESPQGERLTVMVLDDLSSQMNQDTHTYIGSRKRLLIK